MFEWLKRIAARTDTIGEIQRYFGQMLEDGRHTFDAASNCLLGGTDPKIIREDLWATDKRINRNERRIRRMLITHAVAHGANEVPLSLTLMSLVKDAERIGDYSKNIFDLSMLERTVLEEAHADLVDLKDTISRLLAKSRNIYQEHDENAAKAFLAEADALQEHCDNKLNALLLRESGGGELATAALTYRYFKRVVAHSMNIITAIVLPLDRLDYYDEDADGRDGAGPQA